MSESLCASKAQAKSPSISLSALSAYLSVCLSPQSPTQTVFCVELAGRMEEGADLCVAPRQIQQAS